MEVFNHLTLQYLHLSLIMDYAYLVRMYLVSEECMEVQNILLPHLKLFGHPQCHTDSSVMTVEIKK
jgi:hypothetical protein